ncbi:hypothetical protein ACHQM5_027177 [Ranunculus cassubicifolius]
MATKAQSLELLFIIYLLSLFLFLLIFNSSFPTQIHQKTTPPPFDFLTENLKGKEINIGLVNMHQQEQQKWKILGKTHTVHFDKVPKDRRWEDYFPEWIDEDSTWNTPKCPDLPMPTYSNYSNDIKFNVLVVKVPCDSNGSVKGEGIRDVFRLQVNLVVANMAVDRGDDQELFIVFIGDCEPMNEIFRCDDLVRREGDFRVYKPDVSRLEQKVLMPFGSCQLAVSQGKQGEAKAKYDFSNLSNPIDHPKEAYVTVLHSSESYVCGAIVLAQSIIQTSSTKDLVLLADQSITKKSREALSAAGWKVKEIKRIRSPNAVKSAYNEWNYSKLRIWQLTEYDKIIFIDSDLVILKNIDNFFLFPQLSAVGNDGVLFNSGIMLIEPSNCVFEMLMKKRYSLVSYNGGDQGFLNEVFTWWHRWPRRLNFLKVFEGMKDEHKVPDSVFAIHYLGLKPWMCYRDYDCNWDLLDHQAYASDSAHRKWWRVYDVMSEKLQPFCGLTKSVDTRLKKWRKKAENSSLSDKHWRTKVKDPRQFCKGRSCSLLLKTSANILS